MKNSIRNFLIFILLCFTVYAGYLVYLTYAKGPELSRSSYNPRSWLLENRVVRGGIYDRNGEKLAETVPQNGKNVRRYLFGPLYSQIIGYNTRMLGKSGLESSYNSELLGLSGSLLKSLEVRWGVKGIKGNDLTLTIDHKLQQKAAELLGSQPGAAVAINPQTGEILALVSNPGFDPNQDNLDQNWKKISADSAHPLINRATNGLYPPGSTMKIVTASMGLKQFPGLGNEPPYNCKGYVVINGRTLKDMGVHGEVDYRRALKVSCNSYYATLGMRIGSQSFVAGLEQFGWGRKIPLEIPFTANPLSRDSLQTRNGLAESAIGQGKIVVTPLSMAMIAGAIANHGIMMKPYLVSAVKSPEGKVLSATRPSPLLTATSPEIASAVRDAMIGVVSGGTGTAAALPGIEVAGKTGSAENPEGDTHAWFVGFAPASSPKVAVAVMLEHGGLGGRVAAPIARELMKLALAQGG